MPAPRILVLFGNVPLWGQERANIETLHALQEAGCAVLFAVRKEWTSDSIQPELRRRGLEFVTVRYFDALLYGMSLRTWWNNVAGICVGSWQLLRLIRSFKASHIHAGSVANVLNFLPALVLSRIPLIFRAGDVPPAHHALWRWVWRYTCRRASHVVCDTHFVRNRLISMGLAAEKSRVIYPPAPRRAANERDRVELKDAARFTFLYIGQISADKGVDLLVEAARCLCREHSDIRFLIAGDYSWNNALGERLVSELEREGLSSQIRFLGYIDDIEGLYRHADVHVCPSVCEEAYGLTVVEAKERGLPSIVFPSGGLPEIVHHQSDGYVCREKSSEALLEALSYYLQNRTAAVAHGATAGESLKAMGVDEFGSRWMEVYAAI